jgi:hypothetical protein
VLPATEQREMNSNGQWSAVPQIAADIWISLTILAFLLLRVLDSNLFHRLYAHLRSL